MLQVHRILRCFLFFASVVFAPITLLARQNDSDSLEISVLGRVTDQDGQAISNAHVILIAHRATFYNDSIFPNGLILSEETTNADGQYQMSIRRSDPRLIGNSCSLYARSPGFTHKLESFQPCRLLVDYPMDFRLNPVTPFQMQILSETGEQLAGVRVAPAFIGETQIPFNVADQFSEVSDRDGLVTIHSTLLSSLKSVYATRPNTIDQCNQCIEVQHSRTLATATLMPIRRAPGKLVFEKSDPSQTFPVEPIRIGFVAKSTPSQSRKSNAFSWCDAQVDAGGKFEIAYWTGGQLDFQGSLPLDFPYVLDRAQTSDTILAESNEISLKLLPAMLLRGKLVDADSGQGLEGVFVDYYDRFSRLAVSQADGSFQLWCESNKVGLYPRETYGETIVVGDGSVIRPESLPENGVLTLAPTKMRSMTTAQGRVVDEQGHPVAGASIECVSKVGRFDSTTTLLSDRDGNFQFFGLPDGIRVSISANTGTRGSKKPLRTELTNDARVELTISELPSAQFVGSVVDHRNTPIAGASVSIKTAITLTPETFGGADRQAAGPNDADDTVTDASGQFQSPPTTSLTEERSIRVTAPGYVEYRSGWHRPNVTDTNVGQPRIELGTIGLTAQPKQETVSIHIVDRETGTPIVGAKIVTLGALCGQTRQSLTATSKTEWIWVDTPKILAVRSEGYIPFIEAVGSMLESNFTVRLTKDPKHIPPRIPSLHSDDHLVLAAEALLALVPEPAETDTYFKKLNYYPLLGMARPEKLVEKFEAVKLAGASEMEIQVYMRELLQLKLADPKRLLQSIEGSGRARLLIQLAERCQNETERNDYLAEAAIELRQIHGGETLFLTSKLACTMLKLGLVDMAERLLRTTWDNHKEIRDIINTGERLEGRHNKQGVARFFAPPFAIIDPFAAMKLIELTAYANEIERLQAEAICFMASQGIVGWDSRVERLTTMPTAELGVSTFCENVGFRDFERGLAVARAMQPSAGRTKLFMHIAEKSDVTREQRLALYQDALNGLRRPNQTNSYQSLGGLAGQFAKQVGPWDRALAEEFLFESIWQSGAENSWLPYSNTCDIADELAHCDRNLATTLVTPCFEDWSWLFGDIDNSTAYQQAGPILAMASIDSVRTVAKVKELFAGELADQPSRKLSVVNGIVRRWRELQNRSR